MKQTDGDSNQTAAAFVREAAWGRRPGPHWVPPPGAAGCHAGSLLPGCHSQRAYLYNSKTLGGPIVVMPKKAIAGTSCLGLGPARRSRSCPLGPAQPRCSEAVKETFQSTIPTG